MWLAGEASVPTLSANYPSPIFKGEDSNKSFLKFFTNDSQTRYARTGAPVKEENGRAKFIHSSIQDYFTARILYDELKGYGNNDFPVDQAFLN